MVRLINKLMVRLKEDRLLTILYKKTKEVGFKEEVITSDEEEKNPFGTMLTNTLTRDSKNSLGSSKRSSLKEAYDILTLNLCTVESSVTINEHMVVASIHLLQNGDIIVDGKEQAVLISSDKFSFLFQATKKLSTSKQMLAAIITLQDEKKVVLASIKGRLASFDVSKGYKKLCTGKAMGERIYSMCKVDDVGTFLIGGKGLLEVCSLGKNKLGLHTFNKEDELEVKKEKDILCITALQSG